MQRSVAGYRGSGRAWIVDVEWFGGRGAHVEEEQHGHVAAHLVAAPVDFVVRWHLHAQVGEGFHGGIEVEVLPVGEAGDPVEALRQDGLELALHVA